MSKVYTTTFIAWSVIKPWILLLATFIVRHARHRVTVIVIKDKLNQFKENLLKQEIL
jgi:hypothetical protein